MGLKGIFTYIDPIKNQPFTLGKYTNQWNPRESVTWDSEKKKKLAKPRRDVASMARRFRHMNTPQGG